jgi:hypothetical protein
MKNADDRAVAYLVDENTVVGMPDYSGTGLAVLPALRRRASTDLTMTITTRNGRLVSIYEEACGDGP